MKRLEDNNIIFVHQDARIFLKEIANDTIDFILTDPPYLISRKTGFSSPVKKGLKRLQTSMDFGKWDNISRIEYENILQDIIKECYRVLKKSGVIIIFYDLWKLESLKEILENYNFRMLRFVELLKTNPVPYNSKRFYLTNGREIAIAAVKGNKPRFNSEYHNGVFKYPIHRDGGKRLHPTQKSLKLMQDLILIHSKEGDIILDPFAGSATTLIAALSNNRRAIGCEINEQYYDIAVLRLQEYLKEK